MARVREGADGGRREAPRLVVRLRWFGVAKSVTIVVVVVVVEEVAVVLKDI